MKNILKKIKHAFRNHIFIFKTIYKSNKLIFLVAILSTIVTGLTPASTSFIFKKIVYFIETNASHNYNILIIYLLIYFCVLIIQDIILDYRITAYRIAGLSLSYNIQAKIINKLKQIEYYMFFDTKFQDLYALVLRNSDHIPLEIIFSTMAILSTSIQLISAIFIIAYLNIWILILLMICFIPSIISRFKIQKQNVDVWTSQINNNRQMNYYFSLMTTKEPIKEIREYNLYNYFENKRKIKYTENLLIWKQFGIKEIKYIGLSQIISVFGIFISIFWLIINTINHKYTVSDFVFYSSTIFSLQNIYVEFITNLSNHYTNLLFINQFFEFLNIKNIIKFGNKIPKTIKNTVHTIEFKNVWFKYHNTDKYILKNINCCFKTGDRVCIVGHNGSGKTTLVNLILRLYDPTKGNIFLDGIDVRDYNIYEYRKIISSINQDYIRYSVPIKDCIGFGNINLINNINKIKSASQKATADIFIENLKNKYDSILSKHFEKNGEELSGGQWQKLSIARVFFSDADILIFDEPTSAIDPISEFKIYQEIEKQEDNKLKIFISHRMYSSKSSTKIIMMSDGKILEEGTHDKLIKTNIDYKNIFNSQALKYK